MIIGSNITCYFSQTKNNMVITNKIQDMKVMFVIMVVVAFQSIFF